MIHIRLHSCIVFEQLVFNHITLHIVIDSINRIYTVFTYLTKRIATKVTLYTEGVKDSRPGRCHTTLKPVNQSGFILVSV